MSDSLFLDTAFIQALLNQQDQYHQVAQLFLPRLQKATQVWTTEAVLVEVGNALSRYRRQTAAGFIKRCYQMANMQVVSVDTVLLQQAVALYEARADKDWGLTDCISFVVMQQQQLQQAVTTDHHFVQAGYRALMLESVALKSTKKIG